MRRLDTALTPRDSVAAEVVVVIDCIRATTTIGRAIAAGYERVICVAGVATARRLAATLDDAVLGGERHGVAPRGFALGNSPAEYDVPRGRVVVLTTTNGTRAILRATREASYVLIGSLAVLDAVSRHAVMLAGDGDIAIRCAGSDGLPALDDVAVAGRFAARLLDLDEDRHPTDATRVALATRTAYPRTVDALLASRSARELDGTGHADDVLDCAREDISTCVPIVVERARDTAIVEPATASTRRRGVVGGQPAAIATAVYSRPAGDDAVDGIR